MSHPFRTAASVAGLLVGLVAQPATAQVIEDLVDGARYTFKPSITYFPDTPEDATTSKSTVGWASLNVDTSADLGDNGELAVQFTGVFSTEENEIGRGIRMVGSDHDTGAFIEVQDLHYLHFGDDSDYIFGIASLPGGVASLASVIEISTGTTSANPAHTVPIGQLQATQIYYTDDGSLQASVLALPASAGSPPEGSRWNASGTSDGGLNTLNLPANAEIDAETPTTPMVLLRYDGVITGGDFFVAGYYGPSPYPVLNRENATSINFTQEKVDVFATYAGANRIIKAHTLYAEAFVQLADAADDDSYIRTNFGWEWKETNFANAIGIDEIQPTIEFVRDTVFEKRELNALRFASSRSARPNKNNLAAALQVKINADLTIGGGYNYNIDDYDGAGSLGFNFALSDNDSIAGKFAFFNGDDDTTTGAWDENDYLELGYERKF